MQNQQTENKYYWAILFCENGDIGYGHLNVMMPHLPVEGRTIEMYDVPNYCSTFIYGKILQVHECHKYKALDSKQAKDFGTGREVEATAVNVEYQVHLEVLKTE